jgi:virulence factor Mce-like protein
MRRRSAAGALGNPTLVGAITVLAVGVAILLAYNANNGLPFVPTVELRADVPNAAKLVAGNEVREGGYRIGVVSRIEPTTLEDSSAGARLTLKLDKDASPLPADTTLRIRARSALGLKYVELHRGGAADTLDDGDTIRVGADALAPELQDFFDVFDSRTRANVRRNLIGYGNALAFRGRAINRALESLPRLFGALPPVMRVLASREANLDRFVDELADAARVTAPVAGEMAGGFAAGADTFDALSGDPRALQDTIAESPPTLAAGTRSLRAQRPLLASLVEVSGDLRGAAGAIRRTTPAISGALRGAIAPLRELPVLNRRLDDTLSALASLGGSPGARIGVGALNDTVDTLNPTLRYIGPFITVCNNWNYTWTRLADHITDVDQTGQVQRVQAKTASGAQEPLQSFGEAEPVPGLHLQQYNAAIDSKGEADCETGQRGFEHHIAKGLPQEQPIAIDPHSPGNQGPTFTGRPRVLPGQTFSREPEGAPPVLPEEAPRSRP